MSLRVSQVSVALRVSMGSCYKLLRRLEYHKGKCKRDASGKMIDLAYLPYLIRAVGYIERDENLSCIAAMDRAVVVESLDQKDLLDEEVLFKTINDGLNQFLNDRPDLPDIVMGEIFVRLMDFQRDITMLLKSQAFNIAFHGDFDRCVDAVDVETLLAPPIVKHPADTLTGPCTTMTPCCVDSGASSIEPPEHHPTDSQAVRCTSADYEVIEEAINKTVHEGYVKNLNLSCKMNLVVVFDSSQFETYRASQYALFKHNMPREKSTRGKMRLALSMDIPERSIQEAPDKTESIDLVGEISKRSGDEPQLLIARIDCGCFLFCREIEDILVEITNKISRVRIVELTTEESEFFILATFLREIIKGELLSYLISRYSPNFFKVLYIIKAGIPEASDQVSTLENLWDAESVVEEGAPCAVRLANETLNPEILDSYSQQVKITADVINNLMIQLYDLAFEKFNVVLRQGYHADTAKLVTC